MGQATNKVLDVELFLQFQVKNSGMIEQLHIDVGVGILDLGENAIDGHEIVGVHSTAQITLSVSNKRVAIIATAYWALRDLAILVLEDPRSNRAQPTEEPVAVLAVVLDIFEIELRLVAFLARTVRSLLTLLDQSTSLRVCREIKGRVCAGIL